MARTAARNEAEGALRRAEELGREAEACIASATRHMEATRALLLRGVNRGILEEQPDPAAA